MLYALLDVQTLYKRGKSVEWFIARAKSLNAVLIEYRNKIDDLETKKDDILEIKSLCEIPLIVNDEISLLPWCDGIHLGQEDALKFGSNMKSAIKNIRDIVGHKIVGLSVHNEAEILEANELLVDYVGLGAYRTTQTKDTNNILGQHIEELAFLSTKPVAAIGGVRLDDQIKNITYFVIGSGLYED